MGHQPCDSKGQGGWADFSTFTDPALLTFPLPWGSSAGSLRGEAQCDPQHPSYGHGRGDTADP